MGLGDRIANLTPAQLVALGLLLFLVPEPATSVLGVGMVLLAVVWWFDVWGDESSP